MRNIFQNIFKGKVVIVGVGNIMKGDDGFGPVLVKRLAASRMNTVCIDAGTSLENYAGKIAKERPDSVLLLDAAHLELQPGEYRVLKSDELLKTGFTTHDISPSMFIDYLRREIKVNVYLLGVQPQNISLGDGMSEKVKKALDELEELIKEANHARDASLGADH